MSNLTSTTSRSAAATGRAVPLSGWWRRVAASLIDQGLQLVAQTPALIGWIMLVDAVAPHDGINLEADAGYRADTGTLLLSSGLMLLGSLLSLVIWIWNRVVAQGRRGQSAGKAVMGLYLVSATTGNPVGVGMAFLREVAHIADGVLWIGYLWPLWDPAKQTFADKVVGTVVAHDDRRPEAQPSWAQRALA